MSVQGSPTVRGALEAILRQAREGNLDGVIQTAQQTLQSLDGEQLLTTREAARFLGIRSINTLKALIIRNDIPYRRVGNRMMLPLIEVERLREAPLMRGLHASEELHDTLDALGPTDGLTADEMRDLEAARPGRLPWKVRPTQDAQGRETDPTTRSQRATSHA